MSDAERGDAERESWSSGEGPDPADKALDAELDREPSRRDNLVIVSGMSGAGRSTAAHALEDLGWFVVDNVPPQVIGTLVDSVLGEGAARRLAVVVDVRTGSFFDALGDALSELREKKYRPVLLYLEASDDVIVRRQESVRRPHPLQGDGRLLDGILDERKRLGFLRGLADLIIDTSMLNVHQLSSKIAGAFGEAQHRDLRVTLVSFGFKYGIPVDADLVGDMRFLPNPYWDPQLRHLTGRDEMVSDSVLSNPNAQTFLDNYLEVLGTVRRGYLSEGKRFVTVAFGCTGGQHRSVAMTEELSRRLTAFGLKTVVVHRDLGRE